MGKPITKTVTDDPTDVPAKPAKSEERARHQPDGQPPPASNPPVQPPKPGDPPERSKGRSNEDGVIVDEDGRASSSTASGRDEGLQHATGMKGPGNEAL